MKKIIILSLFCFTVSLCYCVTAIHAQSVTLAVSPPVVEILLAPNKKVSQTFTLQATGEALSFTPELHLVKPSDDSGHVTIDPNPLNPSSIPLIVTVNPAGPAQRDDSRAVTLTFEAASSDESHDVYLALVFAPQENPAGAAGQRPDNRASTLPGISALILITITPDGNLPINLEIKDFEPPLYHDSWNTLSLAPSLKNNTDFMLRPQAKFEIIAPSGKSILSQDLDPNLILGDSSRRLTPDLTWQPRWQNIGPHRLRLTIVTEGGTQLSQVEKIVWLLPLRILSLSVLLCLIILTLTRQTTKLQNT